MTEDHLSAKVCLITTGGTIASRRDAGGDVVASVAGEALRRSLHDPLDGIALEVDDFCSVGSFAMDLPLAFALAGRIAERAADPSVSGVVVTHGTDTMEESAYLADLLVATEKPVVFTGAQRNADAPDGDGPRNVADAVRIAASEKARGLGVVLTFEQEFHAARDVSKTHASRVDAFTSFEHGKLGEVDGGQVVVHRRTVLRRTYAATRIEPAVDLIQMAMGADDRLVRHAADTGAKAIVIEGFGLGNVPPKVGAAVADIVAGGVPVIVCTRCPRGRTRPVYGGAGGGGRDLERAGAIFAGDLAGPKARVLAAVLLGAGYGTDQIRAEFGELGG